MWSRECGRGERLLRSRLQDQYASFCPAKFVHILAASFRGFWCVILLKRTEMEKAYPAKFTQA